MARLDKVKNLTGLVSWFAENKKLQKLVNLVIVGGIVDPEQSNDKEEKDQCEKVQVVLISIGIMPTYLETNAMSNVKPSGFRIRSSFTGSRHKLCGHLFQIWQGP